MTLSLPLSIEITIRKIFSNSVANFFTVIPLFFVIVLVGGCIRLKIFDEVFPDTHIIVDTDAEDEEESPLLFLWLWWYFRH